MEQKIQISRPCKTPNELHILQNMANKLHKCGFKTTLTKVSRKGHPDTYILYRSIKAGECDIPAIGYWIYEHNKFYRDERATKKYKKARRKNGHF